MSQGFILFSVSNISNGSSHGNRSPPTRRSRRIFPDDTRMISYVCVRERTTAHARHTYSDAHVFYTHIRTRQTRGGWKFYARRVGETPATTENYCTPNDLSLIINTPTRGSRTVHAQEFKRYRDGTSFEFLAENSRASVTWTNACVSR